MAIVTRSGKGANLTANEVDNNFLELSGSIRGMLTGTSNVMSSSYAATASYALNASGGGIEYENAAGQVSTIARLKITNETLSYGTIAPGGAVTGSLSVRLSAITDHIQSNDIIPDTDGIYDLGSSEKKWFDGYFTNNIAIGDLNISNDGGSLLVDTDVVTTAISADIANIGSINIIEDTISVDATAPADEYSVIPSIVKIGSGLRILGTTYGSKYVLVNGNGTPVENAAELEAAYDYIKEVKSLDTGSVQANDNYTLVISPGEYTFADSFVIDANGIDVVSLTGAPDVVIRTTNIVENLNTSIWVKDVAGVTVRGLHASEHQFRVQAYQSTVIIENCKGGNYSFSLGESTFTATTHWGNDGTVECVFKNCEGGYYSFHPFAKNVRATYINCKGQDKSFGYQNGGQQGENNTLLWSTHINCEAGNESFAFGIRGGTIRGIYEGCKGGQDCFAAGPQALATIYAEFKNCTAYDSSFGTGNSINAAAKFINCVAGSQSFSYSGTKDGMTINCIALPSGGTIFSSSNQGIVRNCINADGTLINS